MTVPASTGYSVQLRKGVRGWKWTVRLGGRTPYGPPQAKGEATTPELALREAADAMKGTPA